MKHYLYLVLALIGLGCFIGCGTMTVMAAQYLEWGRVLLYGVVSLFSAELLGFSLYKLWIKKKHKAGS